MIKYISNGLNEEKVQITEKMNGTPHPLNLGDLIFLPSAPLYCDVMFKYKIGCQGTVAMNVL